MAFFYEGIMHGWCKTKTGASYAGVGERTFRDFLKAGLRYTRLPSGHLLFKIEWIDEFLMQFEVTENEAERITDEVMKEL